MSQESCDYAPAIDQQSIFAKRRYGAHIVAHEWNGSATLGYIRNLSEALLMEFSGADDKPGLQREFQARVGVFFWCHDALLSATTSLLARPIAFRAQ